MLTRNPLKRFQTAMLPMSFMAMLATACSDGTTTNDPGATGVIDENNNGSTQDEVDAMNAANKGTVTGGSRTPAQERMSTSADMRGLRMSLMTELESVRARLNVGTTPSPEREADQSRAADLAQGLERVDRALATMDSANDETWASIREEQIKEVADVREWLRTHEHGETTVAH